MFYVLYVILCSIDDTVLCRSTKPERKYLSMKVYFCGVLVLLLLLIHIHGKGTLRVSGRERDRERRYVEKIALSSVIIHIK